MPSPLGTPELDAMQDYEDRAWQEMEEGGKDEISQQEALIRGEG